MRLPYPAHRGFLRGLSALPRVDIWPYVIEIPIRRAQQWLLHRSRIGLPLAVIEFRVFGPVTSLIRTDSSVNQSQRLLGFE